MNPISALLKRNMRDDLSLSCKDTARRWLPANQEEPSSEPGQTGILLKFPASSTVNKHLLFKQPSPGHPRHVWKILVNHARHLPELSCVIPLNPTDYLHLQG